MVFNTDIIESLIGDDINYFLNYDSLYLFHKNGDGMIRIYFDDKELKRSCIFCDLEVKEYARPTGLGRRLLTIAYNIMKKNFFNKIYGFVKTDDLRLRRLYGMYGCVELEDSPCIFLDDPDDETTYVCKFIS